MTVLAAATACFLMMSCTTPAFAGERLGWDGQNGYVTREETDNTGNEGDASGTENNGSGTNGGENGGDNSSDNNGSAGDNSSDGTSTEKGFTTPGNGDLGDQIKSSTGKDFYTIHTKNNNTFYMVIDHTNSTENVYMVSLIDEDDLAEFLKDADTKTSQKTTPPVILPEAQTQTSAGTAEKTQTQEETPAPKGPFQNSMIWIILLAGAGIVAFYYFKIYKPEHEEEEDDSEGIETGDGLPTEFEE
jgi:hypothetical protein